MCLEIDGSQGCARCREKMSDRSAGSQLAKRNEQFLSRERPKGGYRVYTPPDFARPLRPGATFDLARYEPPYYFFPIRTRLGGNVLHTAARNPSRTNNFYEAHATPQPCRDILRTGNWFGDPIQPQMPTIGGAEWSEAVGHPTNAIVNAVERRESGRRS